MVVDDMWLDTALTLRMKAKNCKKIIEICFQGQERHTI